MFSACRQATECNAQPHTEEAKHIAAQHVRTRPKPRALLGQDEPFPGVGTEGRVAAQKPGDEEEAPQRAGLESFAQIRQDEPDRERARDVDDECAVWKVRSPALEGPDGDHITQVRAEHRPDSYRYKLHEDSLSDPRLKDI